MTETIQAYRVVLRTPDGGTDPAYMRTGQGERIVLLFTKADGARRFATRHSGEVSMVEGLTMLEVIALLQQEQESGTNLVAMDPDECQGRAVVIRHFLTRLAAAAGGERPAAGPWFQGLG